jgi:hypothetical protein
MFLLALLHVWLFAPITAQAQCTCPNGTAPMTQVHNKSLTTSMETSNFSFPQFDPTIGTLICTNVSALVSSVVRIRMENDELFDATYRIRYNRSSTISGAGLSPTLVHTFSKNYGPYDLAASDGIYFSGPDFIITPKDSILKNKLLAQTISGDVTPFLGYGFVNYTYTLSGNSVISGGGNYLGGPLTSDFIDFTLTYSYCEDALLASSIKNFNVVKTDDNVAKIKWTTENEVVGNRYQIEVSSDGRSYKAIAMLPAASQSKSTYAYAYQLNNENDGDLHFRVRQTTNTLIARYSPIKTISLKTSKAFAVHPNPVHDNITMQFGQTVSGDMQVEIRNAQGMLITNFNFNARNQSEYQFRLPVQVPAGMYFLSAVNLQSGKKFAEKLIIR